MGMQKYGRARPSLRFCLKISYSIEIFFSKIETPFTTTGTGNCLLTDYQFYIFSKTSIDSTAKTPNFYNCSGCFSFRVKHERIGFLSSGETEVSPTKENIDLFAVESSIPFVYLHFVIGERLSFS